MVGNRCIGESRITPKQYLCGKRFVSLDTFVKKAHGYNVVTFRLNILKYRVCDVQMSTPIRQENGVDEEKRKGYKQKMNRLKGQTINEIVERQRKKQKVEIEKYRRGEKELRTQ